MPLFRQMRRHLLVALVLPLLASCSPTSLKAPTGASQLPVVAATKDTNPTPLTSPLASPTTTPQATVLPDGAVTLSTDAAVSYRINPTHSGSQPANLTSRRLGKRWSRDLGGPV